MGGFASKAGRFAAVLALPAIAIAVVFGASLIAIVADLGTWSALALGVATGFSAAGAITLVRDRRERARRHAEEETERAVRREAAFRLFWEASTDFMADGWGRSELEALRLVCHNLPRAEPLGERLARRLREASSSVLAGVIDRLGDVALTARDIDASARHIGELERATGTLVEELEGAICQPGAPPPFDPARLADAVDRALGHVEALREDVRPRIVSDLGAIVAWLTRSAALSERVRSGQIRIATTAGVGPARVAVRPGDLSQALDELLGKIFAQGQVSGTVEVQVLQGSEHTRLAVVWPIRNRFRLDPGSLVRPLRVLTAYGATITLDESLENGTITLEATLPNAMHAHAAGEPALG